MRAEPSRLERLLRRDRVLVVLALTVVVVLAWIHTLSGAGMSANVFDLSHQPWPDTSGQSMAMPMADIGSFLLLLTMWWVMMVAMMLPGAAPVILLTAALNRRSASEHPPFGSVAHFTLGYLLTWLFFSLVAACAQWLLNKYGLMSSLMHSQNQYLTSAILVAAGAWQFSSIKLACLRHCRSPIEFITRWRRPGNRGALLMGLHHGTYCLGCCWFLMALLFVGGVMNPYWIAGLTILVLIEKLCSGGIWFGRIAGACFFISGVVLIVL